MTDLRVAGKGLSLPADWQMVKLGQVLQRVRRPVDVEADKTYHEIGIRSHGKGIFYKEPTTGAALGEKAVFWVQPDCFIVNIVFAWEQAVAKTAASEVGMIASHRFPMYKPKEDTLDLDYVVRFFKTPLGKYLLGLASPGGAGRNKTLGQEAFLDLSIPLPPYPEQRKIATILGTWDEAIALTERRIAAGQQRKGALVQDLLEGKVRFPDYVGQEWVPIRLRDISLVNPPKPAGLSEDTDISFVAMADVSEDGQIVNIKRMRYCKIKSSFTPFQQHDVLIAKITPCFENGKGALVRALETECGFGSTEFHVLRANPDRVLPEYLYYHTVARDFKRRGTSSMVGSAGQKRVQKDFIATYEIMLPSLPEQRRIAEVLAACDRELDLLARKRDALQRQKRGLMQQLLTGRVRVKE